MQPGSDPKHAAKTLLTAKILLAEFEVRTSTLDVLDVLESAVASCIEQIRRNTTHAEFRKCQKESLNRLKRALATFRSSPSERVGDTSDVALECMAKLESVQAEHQDFLRTVAKEHRDMMKNRHVAERYLEEARTSLKKIEEEKSSSGVTVFIACSMFLPPISCVGGCVVNATANGSGYAGMLPGLFIGVLLAGLVAIASTTIPGPLQRKAQREEGIAEEALASVDVKLAAHAALARTHAQHALEMGLPDPWHAEDGPFRDVIPKPE